ncbi:MAG: pyruvate formate lyase family protein [Clostridia bacterium]|nr:pyruvate formate lyase family protein [Clostridia bacterium]
MMEQSLILEKLRPEVSEPGKSGRVMTGYYRYLGYRDHYDEPNRIARAFAIRSMFLNTYKHIYDHDLIIGSVRGFFTAGDDFNISDQDVNCGNNVAASYGDRSFPTNSDHAAPDYAVFLKEGIAGTIERIELSQKKAAERGDGTGVETLKAMHIAMCAFRDYVLLYAAEAEKHADAISGRDPEAADELRIAAGILRKLSHSVPETFREALQLIWLVYIAFCMEGRYAMAFGRLDKFLEPYYERDKAAGIIDYDSARELMIAALYKIRERRILFGADDVSNIAIGGLNADGSGGINEVSYIILDAVGTMQIPGPNLSLRYYEGIPDDFMDKALQVVGTGLGYPAMMNDMANIPSLLRHGYAREDAFDYCMVGCIENFIQGKQPPWSDGRYNTPKYLELALNNGVDMLSGAQRGPETGNPEDFKSMDDLMAALETQMRYGASEYVVGFNNVNDGLNPARYNQAFLSCFFEDCIGRGRDINEGGALYPSVHGAAVMGIGTMADSLAAVETVIFTDKKYDMKTLVDALKADYEGYDELRAALFAAPKYGNDNEVADKYAEWFVSFQNEIFSKHRTRDGGAFTSESHRT